MALEKARITNCKTNASIDVMFNPDEYTVNRDINYAQTAIPGLSAPVLQFVSGNMQTLEMELFLDTYEEHRIGARVQNRAREDVRRLTRAITDLMTIQPATHAPPLLTFTWASLSFNCVLARANQQFTMFMPDGTPVRAKLKVTFNEFCDVDLEAKDIKRETVDYSKYHVVGQGETLSGIAAREYGNARLWRPIALHNNIDDPRSLPAGTRLALPRLPFRDPRTGEVYQ